MKAIKIVFLVASSLRWYTAQAVHFSSTLMLCELNRRTLYPRLAGIVFDLASITEAGKVVKRTRLCVCGVGGERCREKHGHFSLLQPIFVFLVDEHNRNPGITVDSTEKHVHNSLMCHPRAP